MKRGRREEGGEAVIRQGGRKEGGDCEGVKKGKMDGSVSCISWQVMALDVIHKV